MFFKKRREFYFLAAFFLTFYLIYFSSWEFLTGSGGDRFLINFYLITSIFAGYGLFLIYQITSLKIHSRKIKVGITSLLVIILLMSFFPYINSVIKKNPGPVAKLEIEISDFAQKNIPSNCMIIAESPQSLTATTDLKVISLYSFLGNKNYSQGLFNKTDCVLLFEDYCRRIPGYPGFGKIQEKYRRMRNEYNLTPYLTFPSGLKPSVFYKFYKVSKKDTFTF